MSSICFETEKKTLEKYTEWLRGKTKLISKMDWLKIMDRSTKIWHVKMIVHIRKTIPLKLRIVTHIDAKNGRCIMQLFEKCNTSLTSNYEWFATP